MKTMALIPVFHVKDVDAALQCYTEVLGFTLSFRYGTYAGLRFGSHELHLTIPGEPRHVIGAGSAYVICDGVDHYFTAISSRGAAIKSEPGERGYAMRDFSVFDLDGNQLTFGEDVGAD